MTVRAITSGEDFKKALGDAGDKLVLVDFFADWCGPCKMIAPHLEKFSKTYEAGLIILKVNVDDQEELAAEYKIEAMPTFMFFKKGEKVGELCGANKDKLEDLIKQKM